MPEGGSTSPEFTEGAGKDLRDFVDIAYEIYSSKQVVNAYFDYIVEEARAFVFVPRHWKCIKAIANELIKRKKLSKKECRTIYDSVMFKT